VKALFSDFSFSVIEVALGKGLPPHGTAVPFRAASVARPPENQAVSPFLEHGTTLAVSSVGGSPSWEGSPMRGLRFHLLTLLAGLVTAAGAASAATVPIGTIAADSATLNSTFSVVPESGTLMLGLSGLVGLVMLGRRR
jgi:hypothetical protein